MLAGALYTVGRAGAFLAVGLIVVSGLLTTSTVSLYLQTYISKLLGPLLIIAAMFILGLIHLPHREGHSRILKRVQSGSVWSAGLLGVVFAVSFCPVSAALFFGSLVPLSVEYDSAWLFPILYGIGSALPVAVLAALLGGGTTIVGRAIDRLQRAQGVLRLVTGGVLVVVGIYFTLEHIFRVL